MRASLLVCCLCLACQDAAPEWRLAPEPGPRATESPPVSTLWARVDDGWRAVDRVIAIDPAGRARVDAQRRLLVGERVVADGALPDLRVGDDGVVYFTRSTLAPDSDVWRVVDGVAEPVTDDGRSDRPFPLPDGRLLWVSGAGGIAGFVLDGRRLTNGPGMAFVPVPARPATTRLEAGRIIYDAGDGWWALDPATGAAVPR